jgi:hypothetical protein
MIRERFLGAAHAFDHPVTRWITIGVGAAIVLALLVIALLSLTGRVKELVTKNLAPLWLAPLWLAPGVVPPMRGWRPAGPIVGWA